jgi:nitrogen fixation negative regulator NifL
VSRRSPRDQAEISIADFDERKAFLELGERDAEVLRRIGRTLAPACSRLVDRFYEHLLAFPGTRRLLSDPAMVERLKRAQARYFDRLLGGEYGPGYAEDRLRVGTTHYRIGLEPRWYLGAYAFYLRLLLPEIWRVAGADWSQASAAFEALLKAVFLDIGLAVDSYRAADRRHLVELARFNEGIVASVPAGLLVLDEELRVVAANRSFAKSCGCASEALLGRPCVDVLGVPDLEPHLEAVQKTGEQRSGLLLSARCPVSGARRPVRVAVTGIEEERCLVVVEDLSEEERFAALAGASEQRFQAVFENVPDGIVLMGETGLIEGLNRAAEQMFGYGRDELLGRPMTMLMPEGYRERYEAGLRRHVATGRSAVLGKPIEVEGLRKDGTVFPLELTIGKSVVDGRPVFAGVLRDITARRAAEEQLRLLVAALDAVDDPVLVTDRHGVIRFVNRAFIAVNGYTAEEVIGRKPSLLKSGLTHPAVYRDLWDTILAGRTFRGEVINRCKDGRTYVAELSISPVKDGTGQITHFVGTHRDITVRKGAEEALRRSEESFRTLIERSPDAIAVHRDGRFVYVNPTLCRFLGYAAADELIGRPVTDIVHPEDREVVVERIQTMLRTGEVAPPREERFLRRDGTVVTAEVLALPLVFNGEPAVVAVGRDLTERKQLLLKMMQMDRMIAVGTLAAGVGHEMNNPLAYVMANVELVARELPDVAGTARGLLQVPAIAGSGEEVARSILDIERRLAEFREVLEEAREGTKRLRDIVRDLRTLSRAEEERREPVSVQRVLESAINMAWNEIRHRARLVKDYGTTPHVVANESRLGQVFLNLLVNAAQAIPEGQAEKNEIRVRTLVDGEWVAVEIRDTGAGIAPEHLPHIFDPFFTTKPMGQGTGLGLAICQGIIHGLGGEIAVESEVGKGSCFRVMLPAGEVVAAEPARTTAVPGGRRGRILVVDDEPMVGNSLRRILAVDHDVVVVPSGRAALDLLIAKERFDLILCDLMMPEMTGMDLHEELARSFPEHAAKMIFLTGGAFTPRAREFLDRVPNQRLEKPFDVQNLRALVRELVSRR